MSTSQAIDSAIEATIDAPGPEAARGRPIALVEGSGPQLSAETRSVIRRRLSAVGAVAFAGLAVFLIWDLFVYDLTQRPFQLLYGAHLVATLLVGAATLVVWRSKSIGVGGLQLTEFVLFAAPAVFFLMLQQLEMRQWAEQSSRLPSLTPPWLVLIFLYALFIPNTWRRAALVIGGMAAAPVLLGVLMWQTCPHCGPVIRADSNYLVTQGLIMGIAAVGSVIGVHTIGALRREAFEARQLGQYRLCRLIGAGGMGQVYLAEHQLMKRPVAIKLIRPEFAGDPQALARFEREVRTTSRLSHFNSIDIYDYGHADDGTFYYVMEYLPGMSLQEVVARFGCLPAGRVVHFMVQLCGALSEAHQMGLIHRDIKPANVFAAERGGQCDVAKLLDFGLAKPTADLTSVDLTQAGSITGSPLYMAPEQSTGSSEPDARSDIYSLGAVAYFLLTGQSPFPGDNPLEVIVAHAKESVTPPSELRPDVPDDLERVVLRCLAKDPADRYPSAASLRVALERCEVAGSWTTTEAARWWADHHRPSSTPCEPAVAPA